MINKIVLIPIYIFSLFGSLHGAVLISGDPNAAVGQTFSFPIQQSVMSTFGSLYVGASQPLTENKQYALSRFSRDRDEKVFSPLARELAVVNGQVDKPNPFYGAQINHLQLLRPLGGSDSPLIVTADNPAVVYLVEKINEPVQNIVPSAQLKDAQGLPSSGIVALGTNTTTHVFAAVQPASGSFGDQGSGIAIIERGSADAGIVFTEVDAATGLISPMPRALPLDRSSSLLTLNGAPLSAMGSVVSMHWSEPLKRLFIGLDVTSSSSSTGGALAVVVAKIVKDGAVELSSVVNESALDAGNIFNIVGIRNASNTTQQRVVAHHINTLYTSTGLNYLLVVGGVASASVPSQSVFALPLVNQGDETGVVASKKAQPINVFSQADVARLTARTITDSAQTQEEMPLSTDSAVRVGAGVLPAGSITNMVVRDDTVFVTVGNNSADPLSSGVYSSQAIFNPAGTIVGWTEWQRAAGTTENVFDAFLNIFDGTITLLTGATSSSINTVLETEWSNGSPQGLLPVVSFLNGVFNTSNGGIQSVQTFTPSTPGLSDIALMVAVGVGRVVLIQTGNRENNVIIPTQATEWQSVQMFEDGRISDLISSRIVSLSGGFLNTIGSITATTVATNGMQGWLFAGGTNGLSVLAQADGSGWDISLHELGDLFDGLVPGMSFTKVGNYTFVKKLISDDNFLYVVTNDKIDRINLLTSNFATQEIDVTTVATKESLSLSERGGVLDAVISQAFALVATTEGLMRIADNYDIRTVQNASRENWIFVQTPESAGAATELRTVTTTGRDEDITRFVGGQIYVLTSNAGYDQSRINRFAVSPLSSSETMQSTTLQPFNDLFVENIPSFFLNFGNFNSIFSTDGAFYFASRNKNNLFPPRVVITPAYPAPQVAAGNVGERSSTVRINVQNGTEINALQRSQASGSWVAAGDFGMQVLE